MKKMRLVLSLFILFLLPCAFGKVQSKNISWKVAGDQLDFHLDLTSQKLVYHSSLISLKVENKKCLNNFFSEIKNQLNKFQKNGMNSPTLLKNYVTITDLQGKRDYYYAINDPFVKELHNFKSRAMVMNREEKYLCSKL